MRVSAAASVILLCATPALAHESSPGIPLPRERLGPVELPAGPGGDRVVLSAHGQLRVTALREELAGGASETTAAFVLNRLRLGLAGHFLDDSVGVKLQLNLTPRQPEVVDFVFSYRLHPRVHAAAGQMKVPFTAYRAGSFSTLPLVDWGEVSRWFGGERQLGVLVETPLSSPLPFAYSAGLFHGDNSRTSFASQWSEMYGEETASRSALGTRATYGDPHPEFVGRASWRPERHPEVGLHLSGAYDLRPRRGHDAAVRLAPELEATFEPRRGPSYELSAIHYAAWHQLGSARETPSTTLGSQGPQVELGVRWPRFGLAARYGAVFHSEALLKDARAVRAAANHVDEATSPSDDLRDEFHELTVGFTWFWIGDSLKWQTDASLLPSQGDPGWRTDLRCRSQLQFGF